MIDAAKVTTITETAAQLLIQVGEFAATDIPKRAAADDLQIRKLRVAVGALNDALNTIARLTPPPMPEMPKPPPQQPMAAPPAART